METGKSIKDYLLFSWLILLVAALAGCTALSLALSYLDYRNYRETALTHLKDGAVTIARRLSAELMLKEHGRPIPVADRLKTELSLENVEITTDSEPQRSSRAGLLVIAEPIPGVAPRRYAVISVTTKAFRAFINLRNFLFALVPIFGLVFIGFLIQRHFIRRYIIKPVEALAETTTGTFGAQPDWPIEIKKISGELTESFSNREQAVYGHLVRGLIHDLRTYLNSIHTAIQLVDASESNPSRKPERLDRLANACRRNLPKIQEIIDLSLDSSREVSVQINAKDIRQTVTQSIANVAEIAITKKVTIIADALADLTASHDQIQIERALTNILKNAIEASEDMKSDRRVRVSLTQREGNRVAIKIEDSGPGLKDEENAFRPLRSTKIHGHGLGLFVSRKLIHAHGGEIFSGTSETLGGASFTISLPIQEVTA